MMAKTGILLVNLGTPKSYNTKDVRRYLREFLMDGRVIDIAGWKRWLLVNLIIIPFRAPKVSKEYKKLWLKEGSPLLVYGRKLAARLSLSVSKDTYIELAMRYREPSIEFGLTNLRRQNVDQIVVFPLFPQYASATTGSIAEKVMKIVSKWNIIPTIKFINTYHNNELFIQTFAHKIEKDIASYRPEYILFSYHGLPQRQLDKANEGGAKHCYHSTGECEKCMSENRYCYRSACIETTELIAKKLKLKTDLYSTSFQSRLGKEPWIMPYTDESVKKLAVKGIKKLLVASPSFVADCLETTLEIGEQYRDLFFENGGSIFHFTKSLNADKEWVQAIKDIIKTQLNNEVGINYRIEPASYGSTFR